MLPKHPKGVRDFLDPKDPYLDGDWMISNALLVGSGAGPPIPFNGWGVDGTGAIPASSLITWQLVKPRTDFDTFNGVPKVGSVVISEVEFLLVSRDPLAEFCLEGSSVSVPATAAWNLHLPGASLAGTPTSLAWTGTLSQPDGTITAVFPSITSNICLCATTPFEQNLLGLALYVSQATDTGSGLDWEVIDILASLGDARKNYILDYTIDSYLPPQGMCGYTGRHWSLKLPYPIRIGGRQCLQATLSTGATNTDMFVTLYSRSKISEVA